MSCCSPCMDSHTHHPHPCCVVAQLRSYVVKKMREQGGSFLKAKATLDGGEMATCFVFVDVLPLTELMFVRVSQSTPSRWVMMTRGPRKRL